MTPWTKEVARELEACGWRVCPENDAMPSPPEPIEWDMYPSDNSLWACTPEACAALQQFKNDEPISRVSEGYAREYDPEGWFVISKALPWQMKVMARLMGMTDQEFFDKGNSLVEKAAHSPEDSAENRAFAHLLEKHRGSLTSILCATVVTWLCIVGLKAKVALLERHIRFLRRIRGEG